MSERIKVIPEQTVSILNLATHVTSVFVKRSSSAHFQPRRALTTDASDPPSERFDAASEARPPSDDRTAASRRHGEEAVSYTHLTLPTKA